ncbi:MAG: hypothetical protein ACLRVU_03400 [Beduini sp.]|uniref:hypothetical protein n=1 Tax=Beduini sp. TaxID=1922300 RepID=UPI0039A1F56B
MIIKKKKRIRKVTQITALNDGSIINSIDSDSMTDAPSINAVNRSFLSKTNPVLENNVSFKGKKNDGSEVDILSVIDNDIVVNTAKLKSSVQPVWESETETKKLLVEGDAAVGDTLPVGSGFLYTGEEPVPDNYKIAEPPFSNPNLLINGDFQIWQRGESVLAPSSGSYACDRWQIHRGTSTVSEILFQKDEKGISVFGDNQIGLLQHVELVKSRVLNKVFTFSFSVDGKKYVDTFSLNTVSNGVDGNMHNAYFADGNIFTEIYMDSGTRGLIAGIHLKNKKTNIINWAKLEYGELATPFVPKSYSEELALCKRFGRYIYISFSSNAAITGQTIPMTINFDIPFRVSPTITAIDSGELINTNSPVFGRTPNYLLVNLVSLTSGLVRIYKTKYWADAEIY